ncbi:MAG: MBG domain-containing protein, partial [Cyanobacteriota bacterium]
ISTCSTVQAGINDVLIDMRNDAGKTYNQTGDITLYSIIADRILINNYGQTANSDIIIRPCGVLTASGLGNRLVLNLENGNFINNYNASALNAGERWLVYTSNPTDTIENGLVYNKLYNSTYSSTPPGSVSAGNHILYSYAPFLTVDGDDLIKNYGDANPSFTTTITGFVDGDTLETSVAGSPSFATIATSASDVGIYSVTVSNGTILSPLGYQFNFTNGSLDIHPAPLNITANDKTKTYGSVNPSFDVTYTGFVLAQDETFLSGTLANNTPATQSSNVGDYAITPSGLTSLNYNIIYNDGNITINPAPLTVTGSSEIKAYGSPNPAFSVSYSGFVLGQDNSSLGGSLSFSTLATNSSNAGLYVVTPQGLTSANYLINFVDGSLVINPADLIVNVDNKIKTYGSSNPALTANYTGFVLGQNQSVLGGALSTTATLASNAGNYPITAATLTSSNYNIIPNDAILTVNPADLIVNVDNKIKTYGSSNPALTANYTGFVLGQSQSVLGGALSTTATLASNAGNYPITAAALTSSNYNIISNDAILTVNPADLIVNVNDTSKIYGASNPVFTSIITGYKLADNESSLSGSLIYTTPAMETSDTGLYNISASGLESYNYNINYVDGTLAIDPATLTISVNNAIKIYGDSTPVFSVNCSGFVLGQSVLDLDGTLAFSTPVTTTSDAGVYAVSPGGVSSSNYIINFVDGNITVNPADIIVTVNDTNKIYGSPNPSFSSTINGFKLNE